MTAENMDKKELLLVRNIAQVYCWNNNMGILSAVRALITHRGKVYFERKDHKEGDYVYCRLKPTWNYALRPFEYEEVSRGNLNVFSSYDEECINVLNEYGLTIGTRMWSRLSADVSKISVRKNVVDYIGIDYYNPKRINLGDGGDYVK